MLCMLLLYAERSLLDNILAVDAANSAAAVAGYISQTDSTAMCRHIVVCRSRLSIC